MENAIEICSGCGKMPRPIDSTGGQFVCIRCGNRSTMQVTAEDYEKVVTDLDAKFHIHMQKHRLASARLEPIVLKRETIKKKSPGRATPSKVFKKKIPKRDAPKKTMKKKPSTNFKKKIVRIGNNKISNTMKKTSSRRR